MTCSTTGCQCKSRSNCGTPSKSKKGIDLNIERRLSFYGPRVIYKWSNQSELDKEQTLVTGRRRRGKDVSRWEEWDKNVIVHDDKLDTVESVSTTTGKDSACRKSWCT